jgi:hypothetical protein
LFFNRIVISGNNHQGSFLLFMTSFPLSSRNVSPANQIGFEYRWRLVIGGADEPFEYLCDQPHNTTTRNSSLIFSQLQIQLGERHEQSKKGSGENRPPCAT